MAEQDRYQRAKAIFLEICDLEPDARARALDERAAGDETLRAEVVSLLAYHHATQRDADAVTADVPAIAVEPGLDLTDNRVGPYRILHEIGRGGMGVVYMAVRDEDHFRRRVALKVMKRGLDTDEMLRRFELERQLLAALSHPNIARLYDGGAMPDGRSYFAMEYVEGRPIDQYCDQNRLDVAQRLELFLSVCDAVQHAHANLVVHRDLKPQHILVTDDGAPKLLDFGIAKILNPELSLVAGDPTAPELRLMTPEYASPEQVSGDHLTTATDVYSLGVILFELLTGRRPYRLRSRMRAEIERIILEEQPERPSTAISHIEAEPDDGADAGPRDTRDPTTAESISSTREGKPERLRRRLAGDVDNIVLMALRKEPQRRYASAEKLADDIRRHLAGMPVTARGNGLGYRSGKFLGRHKAGVAVAALVVIAASMAVVLAFVGQGRRAAEYRAEAEQAARESAETRAAAASDRSERLVLQIKGLADFYLDELHDAVQTLRGSVQARELIVTRAQKDLELLRVEAGDDPDLLLELAFAYQKLGEVQGGVRNPSIGQRKNAIASLQTSLGFCDEALEHRPGDPDARRRRAYVLVDVADLSRQPDGESARAATLEYARQGVAVAQSLFEEDPSSPENRRTLAVTLAAQGKAFRRNGQLESTRICYERSVRLREEAVRESPTDERTRRDLAVGYLRLGGILKDLWNAEERADGRTSLADEAVQWYEKSLEIRRSLHEDNRGENRQARDLAQAHLTLGSLYAQMKRPVMAAEHVQAYIDTTEALAWDSPFDARARTDALRAHGWIELLLTRVDEDPARALRNYAAYAPLLARYARADPDDMRVRRASVNNAAQRGALLSGQDDPAAAELALGEAVEAMRAVLDIAGDEADGASGTDRLALAGHLTAHGRTLVSLARAEQARPILAEAIMICEALRREGKEADDLVSTLEEAQRVLDAIAPASTDE